MVPEDVLDRLRLGGVAERRRGSVGIDVPDLLRLDAGALDRRPHHLGDADCLRLGRSEVVAVVRGAVGEHLRVDRGSPRLRRLELLEHDRPGALADHEPGACRVEGAGRTRGVLVLGGEAAHRAEAGEDQRVHAGLGAAGEHRVGVAPPDDLGTLAHRVRAGRAGGDRRVVRALQPEGDSELATGGVHQHARQEVRRDSGRAPLLKDLVLLHDPEEAADRRAECDPDTARLVPGIEAGVVQCLPSSLDREQDVPVEPARLLGRDDVGRLEALDLGRDADGELAGVE